MQPPPLQAWLLRPIYKTGKMPSIRNHQKPTQQRWIIFVNGLSSLINTQEPMMYWNCCNSSERAAELLCILGNKPKTVRKTTMILTLHRVGRKAVCMFSFPVSTSLRYWLGVILTSVKMSLATSFFFFFHKQPTGTQRHTSFSCGSSIFPPRILYVLLKLLYHCLLTLCLIYRLISVIHFNNKVFLKWFTECYYIVIFRFRTRFRFRFDEMHRQWRKKGSPAV